MAKKQKKQPVPLRPQLGEGVEIPDAGSVLETPIPRIGGTAHNTLLRLCKITPNRDNPQS